MGSAAGNFNHVTVDCRFNFDFAEHCRANRAVRRRLLIYWLDPIVGTIAFTAFVWSFLQPRNEEVTAFGWVTWLALTGVVVLSPIGRRWLLRKSAERDPSLKGLQERRLDGVGYHSKGNDIAFDLPWHGVLRCVETEEFLLFFYFKNWAYYLPKRALSEDQLFAARAIVRDGLGNKAELLG